MKNNNLDKGKKLYLLLSQIGKDSIGNLPHSPTGKTTYTELLTFQGFHAYCPLRSQCLSFQPVHTMTKLNATKEEQ